MASRRKGWSSLSPDYQRRLGRAGISQRDYESGATLSKARGHSVTPEHPIRATRNPAKYKAYIERHPSRAPKPVSGTVDRVGRIATRIRLASASEASGPIRRAIRGLTEYERIQLATLLGVTLSFPLYDQFSYEAMSRVADGWLLAFMTHAGTVVTNEPWLRYVRQTPPGGSRDWVQQYWQGPGVINIAEAEYRRLGHQGRLSDKDIYVNFKSSYMDFFNRAHYPGRVHA